MENSKNNNIGYLYLMLGIIVGALILSYGILNIKGNDNSITVKGYAEFNVKSDFTVWRIVVNARSTVLSEAFASIKSGKARVYKFLEENGIKGDQLGETSLFTETINNYDRNDYSNASIKGYQMNQSIVVNSKDINLVQKLSLQINDLLSEGYDINSTPPEFYISDLSKFKIKMLGEALQDAKQRAKEIANSVGNNIGSLKTARQGIFQITPLNSTEISDWGINDVSSVEKTIKSVVDATFYIK